jgi:hypothetical protein
MMDLFEDIIILSNIELTFIKHYNLEKPITY